MYQEPAPHRQQRQPVLTNVELNDRLRMMEEQLNSFQEMIPTLQNFNSHHERAGSFEKGIRHARTRTSSEVDTPYYGPADLDVSQTWAADPVDGMGTVTFKDDDDSNDDAEIGFFGISSNITVLKRVSQTLMAALNVANPTASGGHPKPSYPANIPTPPASYAPHEHIAKTRVDIYALPPLQTGRDLIRQFFSTAGMMLPCFHEPHFMESFQLATERGLGSASRVWLAMLNLMFAFGTAVATTSSPGYQSVATEQADLYYQRGVTLIGDNLDASSLESVQLSLIMSTYLMGTQLSVKSWNFHALAVRGALKLGLNSRFTGRNLSGLDREMRKRVWLWCVINDRFFSMLFGRPPMIHNSPVTLDRPIDISKEYPSPPVSSSLSVSIAEHYSALAELHIVLGDCLEKLYNQNQQTDLVIGTEKLLAIRLDVSWRLTELRRNLPPSLRLVSSQELQQGPEFPSLYHLRLRIFLTMRYLNTEILIHRAILFKYLDYDSDNDSDSRELDLLRSSGRCSLQDCRTKCFEMLELVAALFQPTKQFETFTLFGAWYQSSYFVFNTSLVILGIMLVCKKSHFQNLFSANEMLDMRQNLKLADDVLRNLHNDNPTILRCRQCLSRLMQLHDTLDTTRSILPVSRENTTSAFMITLDQMEDQLDGSCFMAADAMGFPSMEMDSGSGSGFGMLMGNSNFDFDGGFLPMMPR